MTFDDEIRRAQGAPVLGATDRVFGSPNAPAPRLRFPRGPSSARSRPAPTADDHLREMYDRRKGDAPRRRPPDRDAQGRVIR